MMCGDRWYSWLGTALLGPGVVTTMPAGAWGAPGDKPAANAKELAEAQRLNAEVERLYKQGKYGEALPLAERALSLEEQILGPDHPDVATALNNLAGLSHHK